MTFQFVKAQPTREKGSIKIDITDSPSVKNPITGTDIVVTIHDTRPRDKFNKRWIFGTANGVQGDIMIHKESIKIPDENPDRIFHSLERGDKVYGVFGNLGGKKKILRVDAADINQPLEVKPNTNAA